MCITKYYNGRESEMIALKLAEPHTKISLEARSSRTNENGASENYLGAMEKNIVLLSILVVW